MVNSSASSRTDTPTVLVLDDEPSLQRVLDRLLTLHRFNPLHATDVSEGMAIAGREEIDAFIVDLSLGRGRSGLEMVGWLREQQGNTTAPVFMLTGNLDIPQHEQTLIRRYGVHVFYKGQSLALLIESLRRMLDGNI